MSTPIPPGNEDDSLNEENRDMKIMGDEFEEAELEAKENAPGEEHDVITPLEPKVLPREEDLPEGIEGSVRGEEGEVFEDRAEDLETGEE